MNQQIEDTTPDVELVLTPELPEGIRPGTGVALAHDDTPIWDIVGNTVRVGNIMLVRLEPEKTSQSDFRKLAIHVGEFLERTEGINV